MKVYIDYENNQITSGPGIRDSVSSIVFRRGDTGIIDVQFVSDGVIFELPAGSTGIVGIKEKGAYDAGYIVSATGWTKIGTGTDTVYRFTPNFNTTALNTALGHDDENEGNDIPYKDFMFEIQWREGGRITSTTPAANAEITARIWNNINKGTESDAVSGDPPYPLAGNLIVHYPDLDAVISGGTATLIELPTAGILPNQIITFFVGSQQYHFRLEESDEETNETTFEWVRPDDYDSETNAVAWHLAVPAVTGALQSDGSVPGTSRQELKLVNLTDPTLLGISSGNITITQGSHRIHTEGNTTSDSLTNINGGQAGDVVILYPELGNQTITLDDSGNLTLLDGTSGSLGNGSIAIAFCTGTEWRVLRQPSPTSLTGLLAANGTVAGTARQEFAMLNLKDPTELTIASGAVTITQGYHTIDTESDASTDDLDTINGGQAGDRLTLSAANSSRTFVIRHGIGNIRTWNGADISFDETWKTVDLSYDGATWNVVSVIPSTTSADKVNIQVFTASGTWTKPSGASLAQVILIGGGGGGGSGAVGEASSSTFAGGGGGGGGAFVSGIIPASQLSGTESVTVGGGGGGGTAVGDELGTTAYDGDAGTDGGNSTFSMFKAVGGKAGVTFDAGGLGQSNAAGVFPTFDATTMAGGAGGFGSDGADGGASIPLPGGGGGGGGIASAITYSGGAGGVYSGVALTALPEYVGTGGSGGNAGAGGPGSVGSSAGSYGGGGGGGGAADWNYLSGSGASGAPGIVIVITFIA
jgi:hypothetical protein